MSFLPFAYHSESMFSPNYDEARSKVKFLGVFHRRISKPVLPGDEVLAYIPTQAVAAYVTNVLGLDGIIYSSTQVGAESESTGDQLPRTLCNVVMFGQSAIVERTPAPPRPADSTTADTPCPETPYPVGEMLGTETALAPLAAAGDTAAEQPSNPPQLLSSPDKTPLMPAPDGLGDSGVPATLRVKRDPRLVRIRAVTVDSSPVFAHLYDDGRVLIDEFDDEEE